MTKDAEEFQRTVGAMVKEAASRLGEHVDSVQIMVTKYSPSGEGNTLTFEHGIGNFCARFGQAVEWVEVQREFQREWARRKQVEGE